MGKDYYFMSDEELQKQEVKHRRALNGHVSTLGICVGLGASSVLSSGGVTAPLVVAGLGFKTYRMHSHKSKLDVIYYELAMRQVPPKEEKKRDVLIPLVKGLTGCAITQGTGLHHVFSK